MKLFFTVGFSATVLLLAESSVFLQRDNGGPKGPKGKGKLKKFEANKAKIKKLDAKVKAATKGLPNNLINATMPTTTDRFAGDPALAAVAGAGTGDFFTKAYTSENVADPHRGAGGCTAWRRTLQCNPSGPRDPLKDRSCQEVIPTTESGFCECGQYAQFAAVDCDHRPFTCESMCVKFAVITKKQAFYEGKALTPIESLNMYNHLMWANQTDLQAMRVMTNEMLDFVNKAIQYNNDAAASALDSIHKFQGMVKVTKDMETAQAEAEMAAYRKMMKENGGPWKGIHDNGGKMIKYGRKIQQKVRDILPFDPQPRRGNNKQIVR